MKQEWVEQGDAAVGFLPCLSIQLGCTLSIHKFWPIVSVDRDLSQCQPKIGEFASITRMGKQRSLISIIHRFPVNALGDRDDAIMGYSTILHIQHFWPRAHVMGSRSAWFHSAIWLAPQNLERQWSTENARKCYQAPFPIFRAGPGDGTIPKRDGCLCTSHIPPTKNSLQPMMQDW